jgi:Lipoxygenase
VPDELHRATVHMAPVSADCVELLMAELLEGKTLAQRLADNASTTDEPRLFLVDLHDVAALFVERINALGSSFYYAGRLLLYKRCGGVVG